VKIGFIGLGKMGGNMVKRLLRGGHEVAIWNRSREKTDEIAKDGATPT
jgi:6-phosphogluconate dehydrogenase